MLSFVPYLIVAHPLFRYQDPNLAGWKDGSNGIVGLKMAVCFQTMHLRAAGPKNKNSKTN